MARHRCSYLVPSAVSQASTADAKKKKKAPHHFASKEFQRGNHPALRAELTSVGPDGEYLRQLQHIVVRGGEVWVMVGTSADGPEWSETKARFEKMFASLAL